MLKKKSNVAVKIKKSETKNEVQINEKVEQRLTADSEQVSESEADGPSSSDSSDSEYIEERLDSQQGAMVTTTESACSSDSDHGVVHIESEPQRLFTR